MLLLIAQLLTKDLLQQPDKKIVSFFARFALPTFSVFTFPKQAASASFSYMLLLS